MRHFTGANAQSPHERSADFGIYRGAVKIDVAPAPPLSVRPVVTFLAVVRLLVPYYSFEYYEPGPVGGCCVGNPAVKKNNLVGSES